MAPVRWLAVLGVMLLLGCGSRGGSGGDDDDSAAGDDDAVADDDTVGDDDSVADDDTAGDDDSVGDDDDSPPGVEDLPCDDTASDLWGLTLAANDEVIVRVDTVDAGTTFDPVMTLLKGADVATGTEVGYSDDDMDCTFPPPEYSCPFWEGTVQEAGSYLALVEVASVCPNPLGRYLINVRVNGADVEPVLISDDLPTGMAP